MRKKIGKEEKSEGIEIVSIGKLYTGPWDKKYWSSSRGKDRYPYPVGYKSVRTQYGVTYTMEILEGLKGPSFAISSTDGKSCFGDTPDIAWEIFQKKSFSKLWLGKRSSCKIDGVEFFGFKNIFVQRLLRESVANVGGTAEQSMSPANFSSGACETVNQLQCKSSSPDPNFLTYSVKSHVKGKRSKIREVVSRKGLDASKQQQQEKCIKIASSSHSKQKHPSHGAHDPSTFAATNEDSDVVTENEKRPPISERCVQMDYVDISDHLRVGNSIPQEERELTSSTNHFGSNIDNLLHNQELSDRSGYAEVQECNDVIPQESGGVTNVQHDLSVVNDSDIYAPDTLDHVGDRSDVSSPKDDVHGIFNDAIVKDAAKYEILVTDSIPEDDSCSSAKNTSSEKCLFDSVGQELAKSMMTVLLPRAVPLLKTFTRKKRKTEKPSNLCIHRSQENNMHKICMNDSTTDVGEKMCPVSSGLDSIIPITGNSDSVVPDSFDNDYSQPALPHVDASKADTEIDDVTLVAGEFNGLACIKQITPKSKRVRSDCQFVDKVPPIHESKVQRISRSESVLLGSSSDISEATSAKLHKDTDFCGGDDSSSKLQISSTSGCCNLTDNNENSNDSRTKIRQNVKLKSKPQGHLELFACFVHPMPISMVQLIVKDNEVFVCVTCGYSDHKESTLFLYRALKTGETVGCPSLIGHAPIAFQISENNSARDIDVERSLLQLTPDAQSLVLLNSIKTPYCREGKLHCSCAACTSDCFKQNAVKVIKLNRGYVSLVIRLETTQGICCLLVCESNFLLAAEDGGKLKMWIMNSGWSEQNEECYLPTFDCMFPSIVELKTIPKSASLVVGHNGSGEYGLWDIRKRSLVSKFSSPGMSVSGFIPVGIFRWQRKGECKTKALVADIMDATRMSFSGRTQNHVFSPEDKDACVWLLISTASDQDSQSYQSFDQEEASLGGCWRLALLVNNTVITGSDVDKGAAAVTSAGHGIMGRLDGVVYMWELSTGMRLGNLQSSKGGRVSSITRDSWNSDAFAVTSEGELRVYLPS